MASSTSPSRLLPDPDGGDWLRRISPGQATREPAVGDRDHKFLPGPRRLRRKGPFRGGEYPAGCAGNELRSQKSDPVAREGYEESRRAIRIGGCGGARTR